MMHMNLVSRINNLISNSKNESGKFESIDHNGKEWEVVKRLGDSSSLEGFFMKVDIYKVKRRGDGARRKVVKGFAVITEMRTQKEDWHFWVEEVFRHRGDAEILLEKKIREIASDFSVLSQYEKHISKAKKVTFAEAQRRE